MGDMKTLPAAHTPLSHRSPRRSAEARGHFCLEITWRLEEKRVGAIKNKKNSQVTLHSGTPFPSEKWGESKRRHRKPFLEFSAVLCAKEWTFVVSQESRFAQRAEEKVCKRGAEGGWEGGGHKGTAANDYRGQRR